MDRREALTLLASLPAVKSISRADIRPESVIVLETDHSLSAETAERLQTYLQAAFPDHKCMILGDGLRMKLLDGRK